MDNVNNLVRLRDRLVHPQPLRALNLLSEEFWFSLLVFLAAAYISNLTKRHAHDADAITVSLDSLGSVYVRL